MKGSGLQRRGGTSDIERILQLPKLWHGPGRGQVRGRWQVGSTEAPKPPKGRRTGEAVGGFAGDSPESQEGGQMWGGKDGRVGTDMAPCAGS